MAAVIGGFLFGFSSYETTETMSALNLDFVVFIPCVLIVAFDRLTGRITRRRAAGLIGLLLAAQFYVSTEILASFCLFGALAWCFAMAFLPERRGALRMFCFDVLCALPVTLILAAPLLLPMLLGPRDVGVSRAWAIEWAAEPFNLLVPLETQLTYTPGSRGFNNGLFGLLPQSDITTGLPILVILCLFAARNWHIRDIRFLYLTLFAILAASLGPFLWFQGRLTYIPLPWLAALFVPLINGALPVRFELYGTLLTALLVALWIAQDGPGRKWLRIGLGILACILPLPPPHPTMPAPYLKFFAPGRVEAALDGPARLLILPQGNLDMSTFWQAQNDFGFAQTQGYLGMPPNSMLRYAAVRDFITPAPSSRFAADFRTLCLATGTRYVIAGPQTTPYILQAVQTLGWPARKIDDVTVFTTPTRG